MPAYSGVLRVCVWLLLSATLVCAAGAAGRQEHKQQYELWHYPDGRQLRLDRDDNISCDGIAKPCYARALLRDFSEYTWLHSAC